ncbi:MAG: hypothetical protein IT426_18655 [Pirellulales bacterium]|nr:hypothetical protein [Pirellulales bacterium]
MDKTLLVEANVDQAAKLIELLDETEMDVLSALWIYDPYHEQWQLVIATPMIEHKGPQRAYRVIQKILANNSELAGLTLQDVRLVSDKNNSLIKTFRKNFKTGKTINQIRFSKNVIDGVYIEDAIILRMQ